MDSQLGKCECEDPGCPACGGACRAAAETVLYRVDMDDEGGTAFCSGCAADALDAGVFTSEQPETL